MANVAVEQLISRSNRLGADPKNTNYAGGNTSAKGTETDPVTNEDVELVWVKGSGGDLGTLTPAGLAALRLDRMRATTRLRSNSSRARRRSGRVARRGYQGGSSWAPRASIWAAGSNSPAASKPARSAEKAAMRLSGRMSRCRAAWAR